MQDEDITQADSLLQACVAAGIDSGEAIQRLVLTAFACVIAVVQMIAR